MTDRLMTLREVQAVVGLRHSAIYARIADGRFPAPRRLSAGCVRWLESDIQAWIAALPVQRAA